MRLLTRALLFTLLLCNTALADPADGFVEVREAVPGVMVDLRYLTADNFVGEPIDVGRVVPAVALVHEVHLPGVHVVGDDEQDIGALVGKQAGCKRKE